MIYKFDMVSYIKEGLAIGYALLGIICFVITRIYPEQIVFGYSLFKILTVIWVLLFLNSARGAIKASSAGWAYIKQIKQDIKNEK